MRDGGIGILCFLAEKTFCSELAVSAVSASNNRFPLQCGEWRSP